MILLLKEGLLLFGGLFYPLCSMQYCGMLSNNWVERDQEEWKSGKIESSEKDLKYSWIMWAIRCGLTTFSFQFSC